MIGAYAMYAWPEVADEVQAFWSELAERCRGAGLAFPAQPSNRADVSAVWRDPKMILSQTCGYPYTMLYRDELQLVATPHYVVPGCDGPAYRSVLLQRDDDTRGILGAFRGSVAAMNDRHSQSGMNAFFGTLVREGQEGPFFERIIWSGGHRQSMRLVAEGQADLCACDAVCWQLLQDVEPETARKLKPLTWSGSVPGLPFVTSKKTDSETLAALRRALAECLAEGQWAQSRLYLSDVTVLQEADYDVIPAMSENARLKGFSLTD
ncbi:phosphate/phosphite/phosphonate ABC transporter substrate-binding protein [Coralliovum pocilloporae]|uniref:phosphate/phosphite/phosphonate ABC transporter substrate-binding protein n=1 Tax=Coralliovum pocilloporae TaxID=3066369 RepID=UPI003307BD38